MGNVSNFGRIFGFKCSYRCLSRDLKYFSEKNSTVAGGRDSKQITWNLNFRRGIFDRELREWIGLTKQLEGLDWAIMLIKLICPWIPRDFFPPSLFSFIWSPRDLSFSIRL